MTDTQSETVEKMKYKFSSYYKYQFCVVGEDGKLYFLDSELCNSGDIYRFEIEGEGYMEKDNDGDWTIDSAKFFTNS